MDLTSCRLESMDRSPLSDKADVKREAQPWRAPLRNTIDLEIRPWRAMMESTISVAVGIFWGGEQELAAGAPLAIREPALGAAFAWVGSGRSGASGRARPSILCFASN
jgi:hypothetical protein